VVAGVEEVGVGKDGEPCVGIRTVALPTKKIEPFANSGFSLLLGRSKEFAFGTGSSRRGRRLQFRYDLVLTRVGRTAQSTKPLHQILRRPVALGDGDQVLLARRIIYVFQVLRRLIGLEVHDILLWGR
jgi:hypothetical protein